MYKNVFYLLKTLLVWTPTAPTVTGVPPVSHTTPTMTVVPPVTGSKRATANRPWESLTSFVDPPSKGQIASTGAFDPPLAVHEGPHIPTEILTSQPKTQLVAGVDTSVGLLPDPVFTPQKKMILMRSGPYLQLLKNDLTVKL